MSVSAPDCGVGEAGRGELGGGEVDGPVAIISDVVVMIGEEMVVAGAATGSEVRGGEGATGSAGCVPSRPTTPWSAGLLETSEAAVEAAVLLAASRRDFLAARSASLELRGGAAWRLRTPGAAAASMWGGMS